jgi:hypothetical protein
MDSNLIIDAEFVEPSNAASNVPIHWIECSIERTTSPDGTSAISDQMLINSSLELDPEQRKNYSPSDEKLGLGLQYRPLWQTWPSSFRGCVFLRIIAKTATLCVIRGELQHPDVPHASRYYSHGLWLFLPGAWFTNAEKPDLRAEAELADQLYSVLAEALTRTPTEKAHGKAQPLQVTRRKPPFTMIPSPRLVRSAEYAADGHKQLTIYEPEPPSASSPLEAALLCQMILAARRTNKLENILERGIALYPPPHLHSDFAWVVTSADARTTAPMPPSSMVPPAEDATAASRASAPPHKLVSASDRAGDNEAPQSTEHQETVLRRLLSLFVAVSLLGVGLFIGYSVSLLRNRPRICNDLLTVVSDQVNQFPERAAKSERERCRQVIFYRQSRLSYCLKEVMDRGLIYSPIKSDLTKMNAA